jgi:pimeloyl-ACP methyl ester carboxylesterase
VLAALLLAALTGSGVAPDIPPGPPGDAFYLPPKQLPSTTEGTVIWTSRFSDGAALRSAAANYRVLYESVSPAGTFVGVSGTVAIPRGTPPSGGWPLISWAHGTVGNAPDCAPSRSDEPNVEQRMLDAFVQHGYAVAQTDYEGNGTPGIHPYMVALAAGRDVTDMAIAARRIDPQIGRKWLVMGHSEGGAAALATAALGPQLAPNLHLVGAVSYAPFAFPESTLEYELHNGAPNGGLVILGLIIEGYATVDPRVVPSQILEPRMKPLMAELQQQCLTELMRHSDWSDTVPSTAFAPQGQSSVEALYRDLVQNDPAYFVISVPTLLVQGVSDTMVAPQSTMTVEKNLRRNGTPVTLKTYMGATHGSVLAKSLDDVLEWTAARFAQAGDGS